MENISEVQLEMLRQRAKRRTIIVYVLSGLSIFFFLWLFYALDIEIESSPVLRFAEAIFVSLVLAAGALGLFWLLFAKSAYQRFENNFKNKYVMQLVQSIPGFSDLYYQPKSGFQWEDIRNAAVVNCGDQKYFCSEDFLSGAYEGLSFELSDVTTQHLVRSGKKTRVDEIFSGQVICFHRFDDRKESDGHLQIFQKEFLSNIKGWTAGQKVETDHAGFNSKFQIYASDAHNAYYILTPQVIEKIMEFAAAVDEQIAITFRGKYMFVAICRIRSMFNPVVDVPVHEQTQYILDDMELLQKAKEILIAD